jgi:CRISPR-associated protein Csd1
MILQSLNRFYRILRDDPQTEIPRFGYSIVGVSFALNLSSQGQLLDLLPLSTQEQRGRRTVEVPRPMLLPQKVKRTVNVAPNFLWDNSAYVLGLSDRDDEKPEYSRARFEAFRQLHKDLLNEVDNAAARAIVSFLDGYDPSSGRDHPAIARHLETILQGGNLVFMVEGAFLHKDEDIQHAWEAHQDEKEAERMQCLVTGEVASVARLHPSLKRVRGAQPSGASLVSFNERAYESYNRTKEQGLNSPVSERATFAYTTALNYLLSDANPNKKFYMGDTTVIYWAESENRAYEASFASILDPDYVANGKVTRHTRSNNAETAMKAAAEKVKRVQMLDLEALLASLEDENPRFYVLGLAPNAARISVRFFITDPFNKIVDNIMSHYRDLEIVKEYADQPDYLTVGRILNETVSKKSRDRDATPLLAGAVFRAILTNAPYPAALYNAILNRVRSDMDDPQRRIRKINYTRAAVIKAFLMRKYRRHPQNPFEEVMTMALNEQSTLPAYLLGRLFAVLERVQADAIGEMNATIKDRYFTSACASPASVFPILLRLSQHHIAKAEYGRASDRRIEQILDLLDVERNPIPSRLTLDEQGIFVLGYYHQRADFFKPKKEEPIPENT